jgi:integrase
MIRIEVTCSKRGDQLTPTTIATRLYAEPYLVVEPRMTGTGEGLVFGSKRVERFPINALVRRARTAWQAAGLTPILLHECRHRFASLMIAAGVNPKALQTHMGHANIATTMDLYGHLMPDAVAEAAAPADAYPERANNRARLRAPGPMATTDPS